MKPHIPAPVGRLMCRIGWHSPKRKGYRLPTFSILDAEDVDAYICRRPNCSWVKRLTIPTFLGGDR